MAAYPERLLVTGERVAVHVRPHWRMLVVPALLPPVVAFAAGWLAAVGSGTSWSATVTVVVVVASLALVGWFSVAPALRWRATHFVVTDRRILVREGVLTRTGIAVVGASITAVGTSRSAVERLVGCGTLEVAVDDAREPWRFDGLARVDRVATEVERMASRRGGLRPDRWGVEDDELVSDDDLLTDDDVVPDDDVAPDDAPRPAARAGSSLVRWGGPDVVDAEWTDDEDGIDPDRFPRLRRLSFTRRRALAAGPAERSSPDR